MKKHFFLLFFLVILIGLSFGQLMVTPKTFTFQEVPSGETVMASFLLKNASDSPIKIKSIRTTCGCTTVTKSPKNLQPGETFNLKVRLSTAGRRGTIQQQIKIYDDSDFSPIILKIKGKVRPKPSGLLQVEKQRIDLGRISSNDRIQKKVRITNIGDDDLEVIELTHPPFFQITLDKVKLKPQESTYVTIKVLTSIHGKGVKSIRLLTDARYDSYRWFRISYEVK